MGNVHEATPAVKSYCVGISAWLLADSKTLTDGLLVIWCAQNLEEYRHMARQTNYTLFELIRALAGTSDNGSDLLFALPTGLLVNEIGELFWEGNADAEKALCILLRDPRGTVRFIAWKYLTSGKLPVTVETDEALAAFREKPENGEIVSNYA